MTDVESISEEDWTNVEIVGWLYQYYISDENERVIKAKKKYKKKKFHMRHNYLRLSGLFVTWCKMH